MKMNALANLIFLICLICSETQKTGINRDYCLKKVDLTANQLNIMKKSKVPDPQLKCFFRCILERDSLIANNKIIPGAFKRIVGPRISKRKLAQVESSCHQQYIFPQSLKHECDFGFLIYRCYSALTRQDLRRVTKKSDDDLSTMQFTSVTKKSDDELSTKQFTSE